MKVIPITCLCMTLAACGYTVGRFKSPGAAIFQISDDGKSMTCRGTFKAALGKVAQERWTR